MGGDAWNIKFNIRDFYCTIHKHKNIDERFSIPPHGDIQSLLQHLELFGPWSSKSVVVDHHLKINKKKKRSENYP